MSNEAEQNEELEVLASIFPDEFKLLDDGRSFKILLKPNTDGGENYGTERTPGLWGLMFLLRPLCIIQ
jgi:hypothetical protein